MGKISYKKILNPNPQELDQLQALENMIFKNLGEPLPVKAKAQGRKNLLAHVALAGNVMVGFKMGYEQSPDVFYSWLGAVLPEWRKQGIAQELMRLQNKAVQGMGYLRLRTKSRNLFPHMMILNLKNGFCIIGTELRGEEKDLTILFEKTF